MSNSEIKTFYKLIFATTSHSIFCVNLKLDEPVLISIENFVYKRLIFFVFIKQQIYTQRKPNSKTKFVFECVSSLSLIVYSKVRS